VPAALQGKGVRRHGVSLRALLEAGDPAVPVATFSAPEAETPLIEVLPLAEASAYVPQLEEFLKSRYAQQLEKLRESGKKSLEIDYAVLEKYDPQLADDLVRNPDAIIKAGQEAVAVLNIQNHEGEQIIPNVRVFNIPEKILIRNINSTHINKLVSVEGVINKITDVRPKVALAAFECVRCGRVYKVQQRSDTFGKLEEPPQCSCERKDFKLNIEESKFRDMQKMQIQEPLEALVRGEQAKNIAVWLEDDLCNKFYPGDKVELVGVLRLMPPKFKESVYNIYIHAVHVQRVEKEFEELEISSEEKQQIVQLAREGDVFQKIVASIAPSIYGHKEIKEAIALQLFGGVPKQLPDGIKIRPDAHILIIGDPGCLIDDERVVLGNGAIVKLGQLGKQHLERINKRLLTGHGNEADTATVFHKYPNQPVMEVVTESGKSIKGTYNHPLRVIEGNTSVWKRLDELKPGDRLATVYYLPCSIREPIPTGWEKLERRFGPKPKSKLPTHTTKSLAALMGYVLGDGWVQKEHRVGMLVAPGEMDILPRLTAAIEETFKVKPSVRQRKLSAGRTQVMTVVSVNDSDVAHHMSVLKKKRVPDLILLSGNEVAAEFIAWLFEADGTVFSKGRGRRSVQLKSANIELLRDIQILLLRFGIHSRIVERNLCIRSAENIFRFAKHVGFRSAKKKARLAALVEQCRKLDRKRYGMIGEKIVRISPAGFADVYDVEVPKTHRFIANGIISHNTAKSQLLSYVYELAPKGVFVSGKSSSAAGLTATAEKEESAFGEGGWVLKAGALVLASGGLACIDEFNQMTDEDRSAMHEAMEQQRISIAKAGIVTQFKSETAILAAANPKFGRFDPFSTPADQFDIPPTLVSRFDLIFPIKDVITETQDREMSDHILKAHQAASIRKEMKTGVLTEQQLIEQEKRITPALDAEFLRKYISYARKNVTPVLTNEAMEKIQDYYLELRKMGKDSQSVPITARQLEALVRMGEASARGRLSPKVEIEDAERAIKLHQFVMREVGMDKETGKFDIDRLATGMSRSKAEKYRIILGIVKSLHKDNDKVKTDDVAQEASKHGISPSDVEPLLSELARKGELMWNRGWEPVE
jgi:replicative DNA helicase Mcm